MACSHVHHHAGLLAIRTVHQHVDSLLHRQPRDRYHGPDDPRCPVGALDGTMSQPRSRAHKRAWIGMPACLPPITDPMP